MVTRSDWPTEPSLPEKLNISQLFVNDVFMNEFMYLFIDSCVYFSYNCSALGPPETW